MLNALFLDPHVSGGPETYLRGLAPALARAEPDARLTIVSTVSGAAALRADGWEAWASIRSLPCEDGQRLRRTWAEQWLLPRLARRLGADLLHSLASIAPVRAGISSVVTVHDVTFMVRRTFNPVTTVGMSTIVRRAAHRADSLIAVSSAARDEICSVLGLDRSAFLVVPHGAGRPPRVEPPSERSLRDKYRLGDAQVVLCVAAKRPHKNQELLLRALPSLPDETVLVLVGHPEPYEQRLVDVASELGLNGRVRFTCYVSDEELEGLWRLASCAAFPTLAEGFGLPVLEAMSRGVAVACSDIPVLREVGGDVAHYFDPRLPADAATAVRAAWDDKGAAAAGRERAALFSWERSARGTWAAYERALA